MRDAVVGAGGSGACSAAAGGAGATGSSPTGGELDDRRTFSLLFTSAALVDTAFDACGCCCGGDGCGGCGCGGVVGSFGCDCESADADVRALPGGAPGGGAGFGITPDDDDCGGVDFAAADAAAATAAAAVIGVTDGDCRPDDLPRFGVSDTE